MKKTIEDIEEDDRSEITKEFEADVITCDSGAFAKGIGVAHSGGTRYEDYATGVTCEFRKGGDREHTDGRRPGFADDVEDMGSTVKMDVPNDASIRMEDMRATVSSETGWSCVEYEVDYLDEPRVACDPN